MVEIEKSKINNGILKGWTVITLVLLAAYFVEFLKGTRTVQYFIIFALLDLVPLIAGHITYQKDKSNKYIKVICAVGYSALYIYALMTSTQVIDFAYILPMLCVFILCNDSKFIGLFGISAILINIMFIIKKVLIGEGSANIKDFEVQMAAIILCSIFAYLSTRISMELYHDRIEVIKSNEERNAESLRKVIEVEEIVKDITAEITTKLDNLTNSFNITMNAMEETVAGSSNTTEAVQKQLAITDDIQKIFNETNDLEQDMTKIMDTTVDAVKTGEDNMKILEQSAGQVEKSSNHVVGKMNELQTTTNQVKEIVGIISDIANKTNLLALNASIEAARAGDSGLGFAVVASEITGLAKQTKDATDDISSIITNLHNQADATSKVAYEMAELNKSQNYYITQTNSNFMNIASSIETVKSNIEMLNSQMGYLINAMRSNIDSINTVSAISEEVVAGANQTYENTNKNADVVKEVTGLATKLTKSVNQLEQYMK